MKTCAQRRIVAELDALAVEMDVLMALAARGIKKLVAMERKHLGIRTLG